jgi:hypothetical protein
MRPANGRSSRLSAEKTSIPTIKPELLHSVSGLPIYLSDAVRTVPLVYGLLSMKDVVCGVP